MAARRPEHARRNPARYRALAGFVVAGAAFAAIFVALTLSAFHAPAPHGLPVGVAGSAAVTGHVEQALDKAAPGAFQWRSYPSAASAQTGVVRRAVDGALIASGGKLRLLVAQAGGTAPAQALTRVFGAVATRSGHPLAVADVVAGPAVPPAATAGPGPAWPDRAAAGGYAVPGTAQPISLVVGFDNSEPARRALRWSADLLRARPGTLHVVYADHVLIDSDLTGFAHAEMEDTRDQKAAAVAEAAAEIAAAAGAPYTFERRQDSPADAILSAASAQGTAEPASAPIIVAGRSHHAAHQIIGSVPVRLLHQSPYPVLTIA